MLRGALHLLQCDGCENDKWVTFLHTWQKSKIELFNQTESSNQILKLPSLTVSGCTERVGASGAERRGGVGCEVVLQWTLSGEFFHPWICSYSKCHKLMTFEYSNIQYLLHVAEISVFFWRILKTFILMLQRFWMEPKPSRDDTVDADVPLLYSLLPPSSQWSCLISLKVLSLQVTSWPLHGDWSTHKMFYPSGPTSPGKVPPRPAGSPVLITCCTLINWCLGAALWQHQAGISLPHLFQR